MPLFVQFLNVPELLIRLKRDVQGKHNLVFGLYSMGVKKQIFSIPKQAMFPSSPIYLRSHFAASISVG